MCRILLCLSVLIGTVSAAPITYAPASQKRTDKSNCFIVTLKNTVTAASHKAMFSSIKGTGGQMFTHALQGFYRCDMDPAQISQLASDPNVASISEDRVVKAWVTQSNPPSWGLDRIDQENLPLSNSYTYTAAGQGVYVYIVDTGVYGTHDDFAGRMKTGFDAFGGDTIDCNGHGTHVAGTAAGTRYGVAKQAFIVPVRVLDCSGSGSTASVASGIDWVARQAVNQNWKPAVLSMSLGGGADPTLDQAVANAVAAGVTVVVAAGNDNADACSYSPARAPSAITVGSTESSDTMSSFSNIGSCVDIFAPGTSITSAWMGGNSASNTISGTSMATPHVSGAAAVFLGQNPTAVPSQVTAALVNSAWPNKVRNIGAGSPNKLLYVTLVSVTPPPPASPPSSPSPRDPNDICFGAPTRTVTLSPGVVNHGVYGNSETCNVLLQAASGQTVRITFTTISTETNYDFVRLYDGSSTSGTLLLSASGSTVPSPTTSTSNAMYVRWTSDGSVTGNGFSFTYVAIGVGPSPVPGRSPSPGSNNDICTGPSTRSVTSSAAIVNHGVYGNSENCNVLLQAANGQTVRITFTFLSTEANYDVVRLYDGSSASGTLLLSASGSTLPSPMTSTGNAMYVVWTSDGSITGNGFSFTYVAAGGGQQSPPPRSPSRPPVPSPVPPVPSPASRDDICTGPSPRSVSSSPAVVSRGAYGNLESCTVLLQAPSGQAVRITFTFLATESNYDFVRIYEGTSSSGTQLLSASGTTIPSVVISNGNNVFVQWTTDGSVTNNGFSFTYVTAGVAQSPSPAPNSNNDFCANAIALSCGGQLSGSTAQATFDNLLGCVADESNGLAVWYYMDFANPGSVTLSTLGSSYDTQLSVFQGASCGSLACVGNNDDAKKTLTSKITLSVSAGRYYIAVHGYQANVGSLVISATCANGARTRSSQLAARRSDEPIAASRSASTPMMSIAAVVCAGLVVALLVAALLVSNRRREQSPLLVELELQPSLFDEPALSE